MSDAATQTPQPDPFLAVFDNLSRLEDSAPQTDVDSAMAAATTEAPAQEPATETPAQEPATETPPAPEGDTPPVTEEQRPAAGEDDDALLQRLADLVKKQPAAETPPTQPATQPAAPAEPEPPVYTQEEQEFLTTYEKDWPDVARAESLRRRSEYRQLVSFVFNEVAGYLKPHLEQLEVMATQTHLRELESKVSDYDTVRDAVVEWAGQQPNYLRAAYQHVIERGTTEEVADLIGRWREATGQGQQPSAPAPKAKTTELPPATKQAAAALAPVGSKRTAPAAGIDPSDFSSAFDAAAAAVKG